MPTLLETYRAHHVTHQRTYDADDDTLFAQLFNLSPFPAWVVRLLDHTIVAINYRACDSLGLSREEATGRDVLDFYVEAVQREQLAEIARREGRAENLRLQLRRGDGDRFWVLASARLVTFHGEAAVLTAFNDTAEQLAAGQRRLAAQSNALTELTARHAESHRRFDERLRTILEASARTLDVERVSMWRFGDGRNTIENVDLFSLSDDRHHSGNAWSRSSAPVYFAALDWERVIAAHDARTDPRTSELRDAYLAPNGIGAMLHVPLRQDGATIGVLCAEHVGGPRTWTIDEQNFTISTANLVVAAAADEERRQALARLAESEARARLIIDTAHDAFIGMDSSGHIVIWNAQAEAIFGWTTEEAVGRSLADTIIPEAFREAHVSGIRRFLETGAAPVVNKRLELKALHRGGRVFPIEITITSPTRLGEDYFFGAFLRDISERRERDEQLRRAKESAEAATQAKSQFLANMSHELRTPLNGVLGYAQLLQRDRSISPTQREALDAIAKCGSHLLDLITDILDLSKIEAGRVDIEVTPTDLGQLAGDLEHLVAEAARRKGLRLIIEISPDLPRRVVVDGRHVRQVLLNLLGNAIKFTHQGEVRLGVARTDDGRLLFEVTDTGIGIEADALTAIFEAFTQTESGSAAGGTGLGLAINHHLVGMMGGELKVQSAVGQGSRFYFELRLVEDGERSRTRSTVSDPAEPPFDARLAPGETLTAVVADDSTVNRRILASLLESAGAQVIKAAGGLEAIHLAREHHPDVIFLDLKMPDLDGLEATRRLRADPRTAAIPVIAVTASAFGDTRQAAIDAGCVDYIAKPVRASALFGALATHLRVRFIAGEETPATTTAVLADGARRTAVAVRIRDAVAVGDVTGLEGLTQELLAGTAEEAVLGTRIERLVRAFDFDALRALADALAGGEEAERAGA